MGNENDKNMGIVESKQKGCCEQFSLFISNGNTDSSDFTCPICFRIFLSPRIMKCKHTFCEECVQEWGKSNCMKCPMCRLESKRYRSSYGRAHKRLQSRITKLFLKCRNCSWTGSYCQFITQFSIQPYLDDQQIKSEKVQQEKVGQISEMMEQKKQVKESIEQQVKQEVKKGVDQYDEVVEVKMKKQKKKYEIFFEPLHNESQDLPFLYPILPADDGLDIPQNNDIGFGATE